VSHCRHLLRRINLQCTYPVKLLLLLKTSRVNCGDFGFLSRTHLQYAIAFLPFCPLLHTLQCNYGTLMETFVVESICTENKPASFTSLAIFSFYISAINLKIFTTFVLLRKFARPFFLGSRFFDNLITLFK
jgi:hypothetical protein